MRNPEHSREVGTWSRAGSGGDRPGGPHRVQRLCHRLRRDVGVAPPGAELRRRRGLAGAVSMGFVDMGNQALARQSAIDVAGQNRIWGAVPDITPADVTFPVCPAGSPALARTRASAWTCSGTSAPAATRCPRSLARSSASPSRACARPPPPRCCSATPPTASSRSRFPTSGSSSATTGPAGWSEDDTFERYVQNGNGGHAAHSGGLLRGAGAQAASTGRTAPGSRASPPGLAATTTAADHPEGRQPEPGDHPGLVSPGRHQSDRGARRQQLPGQHRDVRSHGDRSRHGAAGRARQHDRADEPGHSGSHRPGSGRQLGPGQWRAGRNRRRLHDGGDLRHQPSPGGRSRSSIPIPTIPAGRAAAWTSPSSRCSGSSSREWSTATTCWAT